MQLAFFLIDPCSELRSLPAVILKETQKADPLPHNKVEEELSPRSALLRSEKQWWLQKNRWENWQGINLGWNVKISSCRAAAHLSSLVWGLWWGYGTLILQQTSPSVECWMLIISGSGSEVKYTLLGHPVTKVSLCHVWELVMGSSSLGCPFPPYAPMLSGCIGSLSSHPDSHSHVAT